ncbi:hypothetical protein [Sinomonas terrae]|uniref:Glycosyltransferase n=1 Tax=Sinomonas terrae TaxID=2908838 RepID=A0ABS9U308_9MICC|nr:hypothetical protein [Sinomonas terrae]MCH6471076.1 hypothetical protein [Sinomonas terrae]
MTPEDLSLVADPPLISPYRTIQVERHLVSPAHRKSRGEVWRGYTRRASYSWALAAVALAALVLGVRSLLQVDVQSIGALGLISALPPSYFLALGLALVGFVATVALHKARPALLALQVLVLIVVLQGADSIIHELPRLEASYRHLGIADYIAQSGQLDPRLDAYFNWPGFFALLAMLSGSTGARDLTSVATWAPVGVNILMMVPLLALATRMTSNWRHAWVSVWMFYLASWVGQDYLSPQAFAFLLMVILLACVLTVFGGWAWPVTKHRLLARLSRIVTVLDPAIRLRSRAGLPRGDLVVLGVGCTLFIVAMTAAHQLTPFAVVPVLAAFLLTGRLRLKMLTLLAIVVPIVWLAVIAAPYTVGHIDSLIGSLGELGQTTSKAVTGRIAGSDEHLFVVNTRLAETALVLILGSIGAAVARGRRVSWLTAALGAGTPVVLYVVQPYGGELLLRLYMYGLPFAASLMVVPLMRKNASALGWIRGLGLLLLSAVLAMTTIVSRYGNDLVENFTPDEINVVNRLYQVAPPGSVLVEAVHNTPWRSKDYASYDYETLLSAKAQATASRLTCGTVEWLGRSAGAYLIVTKSQVDEAEMLGIGPQGDVNAFLSTCGTKPSWSLVYQNAGGVIYHIQGAGNAK